MFVVFVTRVLRESDLIEVVCGGRLLWVQKIGGMLLYNVDLH